MGRKPLKKIRKTDEKITEQWLINIIPIFQRDGFDQYTMDEVVKIAGVSKATFYKYYSSKEKLVDAIIFWKLQEIGHFQDALFDNRLHYYDRYFTAIQVTAKAMAQISNKFLEDLKACYPEKWKAIEEFQDFAISILENFYREGVEKEYLTGVDPKVIVMCDRVFFSQMTDAAFLAKNNLNLHDAFVGYITMKNEGIIARQNGVTKLRKKISDISEGVI